MNPPPDRLKNLAFSLARYSEMWVVVLEGDNAPAHLYLCHTHNGTELGWSSDRLDAKRFQYKADAVDYVLKQTKLKRYIERVQDYAITVNFDTKVIYINELDAVENAVVAMIPFHLLISLTQLPIFKRNKAPLK